MTEGERGERHTQSVAAVRVRVHVCVPVYACAAIFSFLQLKDEYKTSAHCKQIKCKLSRSGRQ